MFVIKDISSNEYYRKNCGSKGWYSPNIDDARTYKTKKKATEVIINGGHHVSYPHNRELEVIEIEKIKPK